MKPYTWRSAILRSGLKPTTRHVLLTLSCYVNDVGQSAYPSTKTLASDTGLSERAVITHLHEASDAGWLKVRKHGFGGQNWSRNEYYPCTPAGFFDTEGAEACSAPSEKALNVATKGTERRSKGTEPNDKKALKEVQSNSPIELSKELSKESKRTRASSKTPIPDDFSISPAVEAWAMENGHTDLKAHFESFVGKAKAKGYVYVNWDQAFQNAIREDWAKVNERKAVAQRQPSAYQAKHDQQQALINRISGKSNATRPQIIDIN